MINSSSTLQPGVGGGHSGANLGFDGSSHRFGQDEIIRLRRASGLPAPNSYFANAAVKAGDSKQIDLRELQLDSQWNNTTLSKKFGYQSKRNAQQLLSDLSNHQLDAVVPKEAMGFEVAPRLTDR